VPPATSRGPYTEGSQAKVSDDQERPDEAPADAQGAVQAETPSPPWGEDFDADRAWRSIQAGRETEKELKERLRAAEAAWDDEDAAYQRVSEKFPHWLEDTASVESDDDDEFEDDPTHAELAALKEQAQTHQEWIAQQQAQEFKRDFNKHVSELCGDEIELDDEDREFILQRSLSDKAGPGPDATERAFKWLTSRYTAREQAALERVTSSKRAPHVSAGGKAGKGPQPDLDTIEGRKQLYEARLAEGR
jgi:hypothetical protein